MTGGGSVPIAISVRVIGVAAPHDYCHELSDGSSSIMNRCLIIGWGIDGFASWFYSSFSLWFSFSITGSAISSAGYLFWRGYITWTVCDTSFSLAKLDSMSILLYLTTPSFDHQPIMIEDICRSTNLSNIFWAVDISPGELSKGWSIQMILWFLHLVSS